MGVYDLNLDLKFAITTHLVYQGLGKENPVGNSGGKGDMFPLRYSISLHSERV